jgi:hypothetical protein
LPIQCFFSNRERGPQFRKRSAGDAGNLSASSSRPDHPDAGSSIDKKNNGKTFDEISVYGSTAWTAATREKSYGWFMINQKGLEGALAFSKPDRVTGHYIKSDVTSRVSKKSQISGMKEGTTTTITPLPRINSDAL